MNENIDLRNLSREQKGLLIAKEFKIRKTSEGWIVPSQSGNGSYLVRYNEHELECECPDCQMRKMKCKHIFSIEYIIKQEIKITYSQNWRAYDNAQINQKELFMKLLDDVCRTIDEKDYVFGRPRMPMSDMIFVSALKVFTTFSLRRFTIDMKTAQELGYIEKAPYYTTVSRYMENTEMTPILHELIKKTSLPLSVVETAFAVDSSGFSTSRFARYFDFKHGKNSKYRKWLKAHVIVGTKTNIIANVKITKSAYGDCKMFKPLIEEISDSFDIKEVSADKAYSSRANYELLSDMGGQAYIPFRSNTSIRASKPKIWRKMYHYFQYNKDEFMAHYHKRSNVETTFHMIKTKFSDSLKSKSRTAQENEILLKILCHNICVLIQEMHELRIVPNFNSFTS